MRHVAFRIHAITIIVAQYDSQRAKVAVGLHAFGIQVHQYILLLFRTKRRIDNSHIIDSHFLHFVNLLDDLVQFMTTGDLVGLFKNARPFGSRFSFPWRPVLLDFSRLSHGFIESEIGQNVAERAQLDSILVELRYHLFVGNLHELGFRCLKDFLARG